jgi:4-hydroxybenzoate polyprenyltransferase
MKKLFSFIHLLRPHQWIKNAFVFVGLIFGHMWNQPIIINQVIFAAIAFCLMSSAVYIYNDIIDHPLDRLHPLKKNRPLPNGRISIKAAAILAVMLFVLALGFGELASNKVIIILLSYVVINLLYTHWLKHMVILDVFAIASGFMLRILAGTIGVGITPSQWLMFCGLMITLFLGFTKRRAEILIMQEQEELPRKVLREYNHIFLDKMIGITASCSIIGYGLYTMSAETLRVHNTANLIYTIPFVVYGIFRYLYLLHKTDVHAGQDTSKDLWQDKHLIVTVLVWFLLTLLIIT